MKTRSVLICLGGALVLAGCTVAPPTAPRVMVLPSQGKDFASFQREDMGCRDYAYGQGGGAAQAQAASNNSVAAGVLGTVIGAGAGAALGSLGGNAGAGAVVGGLGGALVGTSMGANSSQMSAGEAQRRFDMAYAQCMTSYGNSVQAPPQVNYVPVPTPGYYAPPPVVVVPSVGYGYGYSYGRPWHRW